MIEDLPLSGGDMEGIRTEAVKISELDLRTGNKKYMEKPLVFE